jgi:hypothetical protein
LELVSFAETFFGAGSVLDSVCVAGGSRGSGIWVLLAVLLDLHVLELLDVGSLFCVLLRGVGLAGKVVVGECLLLLLRVDEVEGALALGGGGDG